MLIGNFQAIRWVRSSGQLHLERLGARPVEGGRDSNGEPLFVARAEYKEGLHPGKAAAHLGGAFICYGDDEKSVHVSALLTLQFTLTFCRIMRYCVMLEVMMLV